MTDRLNDERIARIAEEDAEAMLVSWPETQSMARELRRMRAALADHFAAAGKMVPAWTHRHIRRGTLYRLIGSGELQASSPAREGDSLVAYVGEDGRMWFRPSGEFFNPSRFELLDAVKMVPAPAADHHDSDCATHNEPAFQNGPCDCSLSAPANDLREAIRDVIHLMPREGWGTGEAADRILALIAERGPVMPEEPSEAVAEAAVQAVASAITVGIHPGHASYHAIRAALAKEQGR